MFFITFSARRWPEAVMKGFNPGLKSGYLPFELVLHEQLRTLLAGFANSRDESGSGSSPNTFYYQGSGTIYISGQVNGGGRGR